MDGLTKLKIVLIVLLIFMIVAIIGAYIFVTIEENETIDAYESLSYDDQEAVGRFSEKLPDYTGIYTIFGFMQYAVAAGLFFLVAKLWNMKKI